MLSYFRGTMHLLEVGARMDLLAIESQWALTFKLHAWNTQLPAVEEDGMQESLRHSPSLRISMLARPSLTAMFCKDD
jgi:hypothetical protein